MNNIFLYERLLRIEKKDISRINGDSFKNVV